MQICTPTTLAEVEGILHVETMAISGAISTRPPATSMYSGPSISSISTPVPQQHASMPTTFKHFKPYQTPSCMKVLGGLAVSPAMQAIVVDCVSVINPQLASIIRDDTEPVMTTLVDP
jgi:hypothetical protein